MKYTHLFFPYGKDENETREGIKCYPTGKEFIKKIGSFPEHKVIEIKDSEGNLHDAFEDESFKIETK